MQNELLTLLGIAAVIAPVTTGFTEIYKRWTPANGKLLPILSIITGMVLAAIWALVFKHADVGVYALAGVLSGLSAIGVYSLVKPTHDDGIIQQTAGQIPSEPIEVKEGK